MRCGYCYNPEIVKGKGKIGFKEVLTFLNKRKTLLDGVVFSGGECTLHPDLPWLAAEVKKIGMRIKVDTNGSKPDVVRRLIEDSLVDYVALDFKAMPAKYRSITNSPLFPEFERSLLLLLSSNIPFEVRTTVHAGLLSKTDLHEMVGKLAAFGYRGKYFLQHFVAESETLEPLPKSLKNQVLDDYSSQEIEVVWRN